MFTNEDISRFWTKVEKRHFNQCWIWLGGIHWLNSLDIRNQYGIFCANNKRYRAHRVSYILACGVIPDNYVVRHKCDNPKCCNPEHLEIGTVEQNNNDRIIRGRTRNKQTGRIK